MSIYFIYIYTTKSRILKKRGFWRFFAPKNGNFGKTDQDTSMWESFALPQYGKKALLTAKCREERLFDIIKCS